MAVAKQSKNDKRHAWSQGDKQLAAALLVFCMAAFGAWQKMTHFRHASLSIPQIAAPSPNGFDTFVRAGAPPCLSWTSWPTNSAVSAAAMSRETWLTDPPTAQQLAHFAQAPAMNAPAIALLRQGLSQQTLAPQYRQLQHFHREWGHLHDLSGAVEATSYVQAAHGQYTSALHASIDGIDMSVRLGHGAGFQHENCSTACADDCRRPVWYMASRLKSTDARYASLRLSAIEAKRDTFAEIMTHEKWFSQSIIIPANNISSRRRMLLNPGSSLRDRKYAILGLDEVLDSYTTYIDGAIAAVHRPYSPAVIKAPPEAVSELQTNLDVSLREMWCNWCRSTADNNLLAATLALHAYKLDHGGYPAALSSLVPHYLPAVPGDPFSPGQLQYRLRGNGYALYSIGPDGKDDGGTAAIDPQNPQTPYRIATSSRGDIVAGVNE